MNDLKPHIALCYIRLSYTKNAQEEDSPDRQRANISDECARRGWTPEWHTDVDGHKSGTKETNRPGWMALKERIGQPGVVAIVANDLARLHRKSYRVGHLLELCKQHDIALVLAAPGRQLDFSGPMGHLFALIVAMMDEYYALDLSIRAKDAVRYRRAMGIPINKPFGTARNDDGYLIPSKAGFWRLADGSAVEGKRKQPPSEDARWIRYFDGARRIMDLYSEGDKGYARIAKIINAEGYAFRNRKGKSQPFTMRDVRRIIWLYPEYGGVPLIERFSARKLLYIEKVIPCNSDRTVMPAEILTMVGAVLSRRIAKPRAATSRQGARPYALHGLLYCAHCNVLGKNAKLHGRYARNRARYQHDDEKRGCAAPVKLIDALEVEQQVGILLNLMLVRPDLEERAIAAARAAHLEVREATVRDTQAKLAALGRRAKAIARMYEDGAITEAEYDEQQKAVRVEMAEGRDTIELLHKPDATEATLAKLNALGDQWNMGNPETCGGIARALFERIDWDFERRLIVNFKLTTWAERLFTLIQPRVGTVASAGLEPTARNLGNCCSIL